MITENLSTLKIHKLTQEQYDRELEAGRIDPGAIYLTPDESCITYSSTAPVMDGAASVGSASTVARSDHRHPTDTSRASKTEFDTHNSNTTKHITSTERTNWNAAKAHAGSAHAPSNAEKNQNAFSNIKVGSTTVASSAATDTLELVGDNVTITPTASSGKITIGVTNDNIVSALGFTPWGFDADVIPNLYVWHKYTGDPTVYNTANHEDYKIVSRMDSSYITYRKIIYADNMQFSDGRFSLVNATLMSSVGISNMNKLLGKYVIAIPIDTTASTDYKGLTCIKIPADATFTEESYSSNYITYKAIVASSATVYSTNNKLKYVAAISRDSYPDNGENSDGYWYIYHKQLAD